MTKRIAVSRFSPMRIRTLFLLAATLGTAVQASAPVRVSVESVHFGRAAETVVGLKADGEVPDEAAWKARTEERLRNEVNHLEAALPRLREGYAAARLLVPLKDPAGRSRRIDLSGKGWAWLDVSFSAEPSPQDLDTLRRAMAQELQVRPLDRRPRPVRAAVLAMAGLLVLALVIAYFVHRRRLRVRRPR